MESSAWRETAEGVGWVAIQAAQLEFALEMLTVKLMGSDRSWPVVAGGGWTNTRSTCLTLLEEMIGRGPYMHHSPEVTLDLETILGQVKTADGFMNKRNHVLHALWEDPDTAGGHFTLVIRRWGRTREANWTAVELQQLYRDLNASSKDLTAAAKYLEELE